MCMGGSQQQGPTYDQQVQADINDKMWDYYQTNYKPVISKYIASRTDKGTTAIEKNKMAGQINADVMKAAKPQSATNAVVNTKNMLALADVGADAQVGGKTAVDSKKIAEKQNIINIGRGQTTKTMAGLDELASMSVEDAIRDKAREEEVIATEENAIGSTIGTLAAAGMYGSMKIPKKKPEITLP
ncbi:MAG: hypothetical protein CVU62_13895 [Deltaproteobacteria bacterium HGW-Deltaproteobacteria-2]|nr:MAG: hypothetical protein CVU62_13895 [Deltaproteobacteria bacterium HGW-Deltaproteobacteria-2]